MKSQVISRPSSHLTFLKNQQADAGGPPHYVRGVLGVTGEGAVIIEVQVLDEDGAVTATRVPHKLQPVLEGALIVEVRFTPGVVEDLWRAEVYLCTTNASK